MDNVAGCSKRKRCVLTGTEMLIKGNRYYKQLKVKPIPKPVEIDRDNVDKMSLLTELQPVVI
jgi:hypothetical protein